MIVELDGHKYHSTKEQLEKDALRQRYLTPAGYTVVRFTGREVNRAPADCVAEVREIYRERMQRAPAKHRVMYIDYPFFVRESTRALKLYRELHPTKDLSRASLEVFVPHAVEWLMAGSTPSASFPRAGTFSVYLVRQWLLWGT